MKSILIFYQEQCPFCRKAFRYIEELKAECPAYGSIDIRTVEETQEPQLADRYDYYYVPTFYMDGIKVHEGGILKEEVEKLLKKALE